MATTKQKQKPKSMYQPTPEDIKWARSTVKTVRDGGTMILRNMNLQYAVDKTHKVLTLQNPEGLEDRKAFGNHLCTIATFAAIGYQVNAQRDLTKLWQKFDQAKQEFDQVIANREPIAVLDGRNIWAYDYVGDARWARSQHELPTPEAAEQRLTEMNEDGYNTLAPPPAQTHTLIDGLDKKLNAEISNVKHGFILCGKDGKQEPGIGVCDHVMHGAPVVRHRAPAPDQAEYGVALCAECDKTSKVDHIVCHKCFQRIQNSVKVTATALVITNDGNTAALVLEENGEYLKCFLSRLANESVEEFREKLSVGKTIEVTKMVEQSLENLEERKELAALGL